MRVLGIDPGSRRAGFALARFDHGALAELELGVWVVPAAEDRAAGLARLQQLAHDWVAGRRPDVAAVETLFHHRNARSALVLAEARGVLLAALGTLEIPVVEYAPAAIKKAICGVGNADKDAVRRALLRTVPGIERFAVARATADATDALAAAVCHQAHARVRWPAARLRP